VNQPGQFQTNARERPVILINTFAVPPNESERFLEAGKTNAWIMAQQRGMIRARLCRSLEDDTELRFVNVAARLSSASFTIVDADSMKEEIKASFIAPLPEFGRNDLAAAGGKGANLGELVRAGLPVPNGFVITTDAYMKVIRPLNLKIAERLDDGEVASIRSVVESAVMPAELRTKIAGAYAALEGGPVACAPARPRKTCRARPSRSARHISQCRWRTCGDRCSAAMLGIAVDQACPTLIAAGSRSTLRISRSRLCWRA
jgi:hypothetical protein